MFEKNKKSKIQGVQKNKKVQKVQKCIFKELKYERKRVWEFESVKR